MKAAHRRAARAAIQLQRCPDCNHLRLHAHDITATEVTALCAACGWYGRYDATFTRTTRSWACTLTRVIE